MPELSVGTAERLQVLAELTVPEGHKLNDLAPVTWEIFQIDGDSVLSPDATNGRDVAEVHDGVAKFHVPLTGTTGTARLAIQMSYGYCGVEQGRVCRLASTMWRVSLTVKEDGEPVPLKLVFPETKVSP